MGRFQAQDFEYSWVAPYNVLVELETGEVSAKPLDVIAADNPVTCALYAKEAGLLKESAWCPSKTELLLSRTEIQVWIPGATQSRRSHGARREEWQHEVERHRGYGKKCLLVYQTFEDLGKDGKPPSGYRKLIVKHDGWHHQARMVAAGGHLTAVTNESVYSGVISL